MDVDVDVDVDVDGWMDIDIDIKFQNRYSAAILELKITYCISL